MLKALPVIFAYLVVGVLEIATLLQKRERKEIILFSGLLLASLVVSVLLSLEVELPNPTEPIVAFAMKLKQILGGGR